MNEELNEKLLKEIEQKNKEIHTDFYGMSVGEVSSIYNDKELDIHPEFQRHYRWTDFQKSKLIESTLLNIPIPSLFVQQRKDGVWDVIDGLQRLSTIFQFMGILKDENEGIIEPFKITGLKILENINGQTWRTLPNRLKIHIKRTRLNFNIVLNNSDESIKYELFQRLNTGGSILTAQEVRNNLLVMENPEANKKITELSKNKNFIDCVSLSDKNVKEQFDKELIVRFIIFRKINLTEITKINDLSDFLNEKILKIASNKNFDWTEEEKVFATTFKIINQTLSENAFKKYDFLKDRFSGRFLVSAFEMVALGIGYKPNLWKNKQKDIEKIIKEIWQHIEDNNINWIGGTAVRMKITVKLGRKYFI